MLPQHPIILQRRFGISDTRFLLVSAELFFAASFLICAEVRALILLSVDEYLVGPLWWIRFLAPVVVLVLLVLAWNFWVKRRRVRQTERLEVELNVDRNRDFLDLIDGLLHELELRGNVQLRYMPWRDDPNAFVTKRQGKFFITITRGLLKLYKTLPQEAVAIVHHEISHIEADDVRFTQIARDGAEVSVAIILGMNLVLLTVYLVQVFVWGDTHNGLPAAGAIITSAIVPIAGFLYYREYLLGREFVHDLRAVQLMNSTGPMRDYLSKLEREYESAGLGQRILSRIKHFRAFHPTPRARLQNLIRLDPYRGWAIE